MAESSGTTLMDLISADPTPIPAQSTSSSASSTASQPSPASASAASHLHHPMSTKTTLGEKKSKRATLMQIQNDTISVAKAALNPVKANIMPQRQRQKKKPVSYSQLARSIHELAATLDQKSSQKQLVNHVFPKLAVYNSVDPSLAPSLLMLNQQCEDRNVLRYVYYYLARILSDTGMTPGGGIPTPNWDALADIDAGGGVTRADVVPRIVNQLTTEATNSEFEFHARRLQALKALTYSPSGNSELLSKLYEIVFGILEKVGDVPHKRKKGVFGTKGGDKESIMRSNLQYAAMSALRRLPLDPGNPLFLHRAAQGVFFADPVAVRHSLEILSELATRDPYSVAMTLEKLASPAGALQDILHMNDVLARVSLARLCHSISRARALDERPDIRSQFNSILYQLLLDPSERVCYEAILCILGKYDNTERHEMDERAAGWYRLTREILKLPEAPSLSSKDKSHKTKRPQPLIKLVMRRLESSFRSFSRPVLHAAARVVQEMGKSRAAAFAMGLQDIDESVHVNAFSDALDDAETNESSHPEGIRRTSSISAGPGRNDTIASLLAALMEVVRTTVACECVYVRAMVIKALIWMQSPDESLDELKSIIASELSDPGWPAALVNDVLLTLHARFKATPDMAVILLEIARIFATKVPGKIDADVLQLLWKTCLVGAGPDGKHTALEAVTIVLDLPPPQPGSMAGLTSIDRVSASDPKSALALQKLVQAAVWFLGENANYAASEYAWESATPPGTALMMLDADKMVAAASSRNPTLAGALTRLQRCAFSGSWEVRIVAIQALTTIAIRSGEPFRLQIYEFLYTLAEGGVQSQLSEMHLSNGEDQGASGTGLGVLITPMLKVLDEMYVGQDELIKDIRHHDNANKEWKDEELKKLYENHERLLDFVSMFCYIPRAKYLPLGPISAKLIDIYRTKHNITASTGSTDPAVVATGISDLIYESTQPAPAVSNSSGLDDDLVNAWAANLGDDGLLGNNAPAMSRVNEFLSGVGTDAPDVEEENVFSRPSVGYDDMWAKTLLETSELEEEDARSGSSSPDSTGSVESSISSHFGGMNYPSLFSSKPSSQATAKSGGSKYQSTYEGYGSPIREEPPPPYSYSEPQSRESFENPVAGSGSRSYESDDEEPRKSTGTRFGTALYDFTAGGDDELNLTAEEELEIEYEVDGWFYVKKKRPGRDGKMAGLVPVLYVNQS
ncbi:SH3 domain-containing protein [Arabidopsis lyrata subsp. lyrata]|uniref:SH3 domain-containing protein n=8 Tax=Arabidopsis TaxID=3701 RepID=D7LA99_ARALL|nr:SH3 domain-containing protein [Arabidopsis lyrata subsp. lyrata]